MKEDEARPFDSLVISCDGNGEIGGHPKVFLHMNNEGHVVCPYCSREFHNKSKIK